MCAKVPPGVDDWGDQLADRTMEIASTGMTVGVRATRGLARHRFHDGTDAATGHKSQHEQVFASIRDFLRTCGIKLFEVVVAAASARRRLDEKPQTHGGNRTNGLQIYNSTLRSSLDRRLAKASCYTRYSERVAVELKQQLGRRACTERHDPMIATRSRVKISY